MIPWILVFPVLVYYSRHHDGNDDGSLTFWRSDFTIEDTETFSAGVISQDINEHLAEHSPFIEEPGDTFKSTTAINRTLSYDVVIEIDQIRELARKYTSERSELSCSQDGEPLRPYIVDKLQKLSKQIIELKKRVREILRENGGRPPPNVLDLHYLRADEAIACVKDAMNEFKTEIGQVIPVITGVGTNSPCGILKNAVETFLVRQGYTKHNGGYRYGTSHYGNLNEGRIIIRIMRTNEDD